MNKRLLLVMICLLTACGDYKQTEDILIVQSSYDLYVTQGDVVLEHLPDVIDYSYDLGNKLLFVLDKNRSQQVDEVGYDGAVTAGLSVGGYIKVYQLNPTTSMFGQPIYVNDFTWVNPWSLDVGDFEGDGYLELFVGCYRATDFYPVDRRPFIVSWDGEKIIKKWTGSYIGLEGFTTGSIEDQNNDGKDELVLRKLYPDGQVKKSIYRWGTFTFDLLDEVME